MRDRAAKTRSRSPRRRPRRNPRRRRNRQSRQPRRRSAAKPAPAPEKPKPVAEKVTFAADVLFDFDKAVIKPEGKSKLDDISNKARGINLEVVIAIGHADSVGSDAYNQRLSVRRSESVKAYLVSKGIEAEPRLHRGQGREAAGRRQQDARRSRQEPPRRDRGHRHAQELASVFTCNRKPRFGGVFCF